MRQRRITAAAVSRDTLWRISLNPMTPLQFAQAECSNWRPPDGCTGAGFKIIGLTVHHTRLFAPRPDCILAHPGQRCQFFEECLMQMHVDPKRAHYKSEVAEAVHTYRMSTGAMTAAKRSCPKCGAALQPRHRLCTDCAAKRRRETARASMAHKRGSGVSS